MSTASEGELQSIENNYINTQAYKETNKNIQEKIHHKKTEQRMLKQRNVNGIEGGITQLVVNLTSSSLTWGTLCKL